MIVNLFKKFYQTTDDVTKAVKLSEPYCRYRIYVIEFLFA